MTESPESVNFEIENDNDETESIEVKSDEVNAKLIKSPVPQKKVSELTEDEKKQLIEEAKQGIENEFYKVKLFKNGNAHINQKKLSKSQKLIKSNEINSEKLSVPSSKYLTDNQLLFEHIINLETLYNKLKGKHKKLKRRYNDLEGYLLNDDSDDGDVNNKPLKPIPESIQSQQSEEVQQQTPIPEVRPQVQYRYVKSWRDIRPQQ